MNDLRFEISSIIKSKIKLNGIDEDNLITLALYEIFRSEYFCNNYENTFVLKDDKKLWLTTGKMLQVGSYGMYGLISSPSKEDDYESQFVSETESFILIRNKDIKIIKEIYKVIKESASKKDFNERMVKIHNKDKESLVIFQSFIMNNIQYSDFYLEMLANLKKEDKENSVVENKYKTILSIAKNKNYIIDEKKFDYERNILLSKLIKKIDRIRNLDELLIKFKTELNEIKNNIIKVFPELNNKPSSNELDFYILETKSSQSVSAFTNKKLLIEENELKNLIKPKSFNDFYIKNNNFIDFIYENPLSYSEYNRSKTNEIEGLNYITDDLLTVGQKKTIFLVAKTKKGETVGVISLNKKNGHKKLFKITGTCVKSNFRNIGVAKKLYEKLAELSIENKLIIHSSNYTNTGKKFLPNLKLKVQNENKNFFLINANLENSISCSKIKSAFEKFNKHILLKIELLEDNNSLEIEKVTKAYNLGKELIFEEKKELSDIELCNKALILFERTLKLKNKKTTLKVAFR